MWGLRKEAGTQGDSSVPALGSWMLFTEVVQLEEQVLWERGDIFGLGMLRPRFFSAVQWTHSVVCFFYKYAFQEHSIKLEVKILETQHIDWK